MLLSHENNVVTTLKRSFRALTLRQRERPMLETANARNRLYYPYWAVYLYFDLYFDLQHTTGLTLFSYHCCNIIGVI